MLEKTPSSVACNCIVTQNASVVNCDGGLTLLVGDLHARARDRFSTALRVGIIYEMAIFVEN